MAVSRWFIHPLERLYEALALNDPPEVADLIFVIAGRMDRKRYGIELYQAGFAPRLLLSIGRFEVSKMSTLDFGPANELIGLRDCTAPNERHFFCEMNASGIQIEKVRLRRWSTYGELLGLREWLIGDGVRSLIIVSTDIHLRRISISIEKIFRGMPLKVRYCPVPDRYSSFRNESWWMRQADRSFLTKEAIKLMGYWIILTMPDAFVQRLMRLRNED
jgi:hypothetical protein